MSDSKQKSEKLTSDTYFDYTEHKKFISKQDLIT